VSREKESVIEIELTIETKLLVPGSVSVGQVANPAYFRVIKDH
jgi:hypothetical protein